MSRGFDLIRRHLSGHLTGNKDAAAKINDASGEDVASDTPWLDAVSGGVRQGVPLSARQAQTAGMAPSEGSHGTASDEPPLTATELLRRQIPKFLRPRQGDASGGKGEGRATTPGIAANPDQKSEFNRPIVAAPEHTPRQGNPAAQNTLPGGNQQAGGQAASQAPVPSPSQPVWQRATHSVGAPESNGHPSGATAGSSAFAPPPTRPDQAGGQSNEQPNAQSSKQPASKQPISSFDERRLRDRRQADQGPEEGRSHQRHAKAARRNSIFVAMMKGLLPSLVIGLVGVFFFYSYDFRPDILPDNVEFDPGELSISTDGIKMVAPKLTGVDEKQQTFEVKADAAIQDRQDPAKVTLEGIDARINLKEGGTVGISAQHGIYNTDLNQIWLKDELEIRSSEGYVAQLSEAQVDFKNGLMVSNLPVLIFTNSGVISASAVQVLEGGEKVKFSGPVVLNLNATTEEGAEDNAAESAEETQ